MKSLIMTENQRGKSGLTTKNTHVKGFTECSMTSGSDKNGLGCAYWASTDVSPADHTKSYRKDFIKY